MTTKLKLLEHMMAALCPEQLPAFVEAEAELVRASEVISVAALADLVRELNKIFGEFARSYSGGADGFAGLVAAVRGAIRAAHLEHV